MAIVEIIYEAKCKHCKYFKPYYPLKKDGIKSKKKHNRCDNSDNSKRNWDLTLKDKACTKFEF